MTKTMKEFLADNDPSLSDSMILAHDLGYEAKNINSELLATILSQDLASQELSSIDFQDFLDQIDD